MGYGEIRKRHKMRGNVIRGNKIRGNVKRGNVFSGRCIFGEMWSLRMVYKKMRNGEMCFWEHGLRGNVILGYVIRRNVRNIFSGKRDLGKCESVEWVFEGMLRRAMQIPGSCMIFFYLTLWKIFFNQLFLNFRGNKVWGRNVCE
jgi:hypothetical protein